MMRPALLPLALIGMAASGAAAQGLDTLDALRRHFSACYQPGAVTEGQQVTIRFGLKRDGTLLGPPRVTFIGGAENAAMRQVLRDAATRAILDCTPLVLTDGLGGAIAGRVFTLRFVGRTALPLS
jgi:hypothetical protein